jgi:hypothetical protein
MTKPRKLKPSSSHWRDHYVDENTEVVYVVVRSWSGSVSAEHWAKKHYPGYRCERVSEAGLAKIMKQDEAND